MRILPLFSAPKPTSSFWSFSNTDPTSLKNRIEKVTINTFILIGAYFKNIGTMYSIFTGTILLAYLETGAITTAGIVSTMIPMVIIGLIISLAAAIITAIKWPELSLC